MANTILQTQEMLHQPLFLYSIVVYTTISKNKGKEI